MSDLNLLLPTSTAQDRQDWARTLIDEDVDLIALAEETLADNDAALRFTWLLSDVGHLDPDRLKAILPSLFALCTDNEHIDFKASFATYWQICGIPEENEAEAIELLFEWLYSPRVNVTTKYPELKEELRICLEDQMDKNGDSFTKRAEKILTLLG